MMEAEVIGKRRCSTAGFEDGGRSCEPRNAGWERRDEDSP